MAPEAALATLAILVMVKFGVASLTTTVLEQRAGSGATQAGSPVVTDAVLEMLAVLVLVTLSVAILVAAAPGASPAAAVQVTVVVVPLPTSGNAPVDDTHAQPAATPATLLTVIPAGITSVIAVGEAEVAVPVF